MRHVYKQFCIAVILILATASGALAQVDVTGAHTSSNGTYTTLKLAFDAINNQNQAGNNIVITITAGTTETATAALTGAGGMWATLKIYPTASGLSISGSFVGAIIDLNGADNVTIDGRVNQAGNKDLIIQHTSAADNSNRTIRLINSAENNTIKYCIVKGCCPSTGAGVIFFSNAASGNGNDNNTIDNCDITNGGTRPSNGIMSDFGTTSGTINNSGNVISNNNFYNLISESLQSYPVYIYRLSEFTISGNSFYEENNLTLTAAQNKHIIRVQNTSAKTTITGNYIGGKAPQCGGGALTINANGTNSAFSPINVSASTTLISNITNNTVKNMDISGSTALTPFSGISGTMKGNITGNVIGASSGNDVIKISSSLSVITMVPVTYALLATLPSTAGQNHPVYILNNTIGGITVSHSGSNDHAHSLQGITLSSGTAAGTCYVENNLIGSVSTANSILCSNSGSDPAGGVQQLYGITSSSAVTMFIKNNIVANLTNNKAFNGTSGTRTQTIGIRASGATGNWEVSGNTVRDLKCASANNLKADKASVIGILFRATGTTQNIFGNSIYALENIYPLDSDICVTGIYFDGPTLASTSNIYNNFIHSLKINPGNTSTTAAVTGIEIDNTMTAGDGVSAVRNIYNNILSIGNGIDNNCVLLGIYEWNTQARANNIYFNTIYLAGAPNGDVNSMALYINGSSGAVVRNIRDNIFDNTRSRSGGTGQHYAVYFGNTTGLTVNYNDYYTPGTGGMPGYYNGADVAAPPIVTGQDANSLTTDPVFASAGGTNATDYKPASATLDGTGITISTIPVLTDFAGVTRTNPPDIGAFEFTPSTNKTLNVKAFLEGLYAGAGLMNKVQDESGDQFAGDTADMVTVELHNATTYSTIEYTSGLVELNTDGSISIAAIPETLNGSYYITVKHRNSVETTTATAVSFAGPTVSYDFTTGGSQAYGDNQKDAGGGYFAIWGGDVSQDGIVDSGDMNPVDNLSTAITFGYVAEDVNGDGIVDSSDMNIIDNNSTAIIMAQVP